MTEIGVGQRHCYLISDCRTKATQLVVAVGRHRLQKENVTANIDDRIGIRAVQDADIRRDLPIDQLELCDRIR